MNKKDKEWFDAMMKERRDNSRLYDALANEQFPRTLKSK